MVRATVTALSLALTAAAAADGVRQTMDLGGTWRFRPDPQADGHERGWHTEAVSDADWASIRGGSSWESQGHPDLDGYAWYRKRVAVPADWRGKQAWLTLGGVNDAYVLYCNGKQVAARGDTDTVSIHDTATTVQLGSHLRPGRTNLIAIRVFDWGGNGGLWQPPCLLSVDPAVLPPVVVMVPHLIGVEAGIGAHVYFDKTTDLPRAAQAVVTLTGRERNAAARAKTIELTGDMNAVSVNFPMSDAPPGRYGLRLEIRDSAGVPLPGGVVARQIAWPEPRDGMRVLNNFVTELLSVSPGKDAPDEIAFVNPRNGWVFVSTTAKTREGDVVVSIPTAPSHNVLTVHRAGQPETQEALHHLPAGPHRIRIARFGSSRLTRLLVRAVPEMLYSNFESHAHVSEYPKYTWEWLGRAGLLDNVTTIIGTRSRNNEVPLLKWKAKGRRWITECGVPGFHEPTVTADEAFSQWRRLDGLTAPHLDGVIADEFYPSLQAKFPAWIEAIRRLSRDEALTGRVFYPYCAGIPEPLAPLVKATIDSGYKFAYERYLKEQPTELLEWKYLKETLPGRMARLKRLVPDAQKHAIFVLGLLCAPPESNNTDPRVSFKAHLDMQMWLLANDIELAGTHGVMEYLSAYADEEYLRWYARLCRHYCIEGRRDRLCKDPYILDHISNPDFADGLDGWRVSPAGPGSITAGTMKNLGWLQGRYPNSDQGDTYCRMTRSADRPNTISQVIRNLTPGRTYSVKMFVADQKHMTAQQTHAVAVNVDNAEIVAERSFVHVYKNCYSHWLNEAEQKAGKWRWFNYHFKVFRAKGASARITLSDWQTPKTPGGPAGQQLILNFIEIEPYFEG